MAESLCAGASLEWTGDVTRLVIYTQSLLTAILALFLIHNEARQSLLLDLLLVIQSLSVLLSLVFSLSSSDGLALFHLSTLGFGSTAFVHGLTHEISSLQQRRLHLATRQAPFRSHTYARKALLLGFVTWTVWLVHILVPGTLWTNPPMCPEEGMIAVMANVTTTTTGTPAPFLFGIPYKLVHPADSSLEQGLDVLLPFYLILTVLVSGLVWALAWTIYQNVSSSTSKSRQSPQDVTDDEWLSQLNCLWAVAAFWWVEQLVGIERFLFPRRFETTLSRFGWSIVPMVLLAMTVYGIWNQIALAQVVPRVYHWFSNPRNLSRARSVEPKEREGEAHHA